MCEIYYEGHESNIQNKLSEDVITYIKKKGVKVGTVREFLTYLKSKGSHFDSFIQLLSNDTKTITCEFLSRFNKITPNFTYQLIFNKTKLQTIPSKIIHKRIAFILSSDIDLLISNLQSRNKTREIQFLIDKIHEIFEYSNLRNIQPFFDALKRDVLSNALKHNPETFILPYLDQLKILVIRSYLRTAEIKIFGKTVLSESSLYIYNFLDSHKLILNQRLNSTLLIETYAHYFYSKEYTSEIPSLISEVPKLVRKIALESYLNSEEIELFIHEISTYIKIMDIHNNYEKVEKILLLAQSYKMSNTNTVIGKLLWSMITDVFLICHTKDIDWLCTRFDSSITKNFFRKLAQQPEDRIYALTNLLKFYYLFNPSNKHWKCKTTEDFYGWLLSQSLSEKLELMIDICGVLSTKVGSTHLVGFFIYLVLYQKRLYRNILGHCNVYGLQSLNRKTYLRQLYINLYPLITALRNIIVKLLIKTNPSINVDDVLIQNLFATSWKLHFEDRVYESLGKIRDPRLLEAYGKHIQMTIRNKGYSISIQDSKYDFYKIKFCEVKNSLEKIVKKLLGPLPIISSKQPRSKHCHMQFPNYIDYYYDSRTPFEKNRNVLHYKGYVVNEASKYLADSNFLTPRDLEKRHQHAIVFFKIYDLLENWRCQNIFINKYENIYTKEIEFLSIYNKQNAERFRLRDRAWEDILDLLSIYSKQGFFPKILMNRQEMRDFLYSSISSTKQTLAEFIRYLYDDFLRLDRIKNNQVIDVADELYHVLIHTVPQGLQAKISKQSNSDQMSCIPNSSSTTNLDENLNEVYNDFYKFLVNQDDALYHALDQIHQECKHKLSGKEVTHQPLNYIYNPKSITSNVWTPLHDLIDAYKN